VQDPALAIVAIELLIEFKRQSPKLRGKKTHDDNDNDGDRDKSPRRDKPTFFKDKERDKKDETLKKYSCFLYNEPHRVFECLKQGKFIVLVMEQERYEEKASIALISLLSVI